MLDAIKGLIIGAILGAVAGLGACIWLITETILFPGDTMVMGALFCGGLGYRYGDEFFEWLREHWDSFI
jgi:hypothetical protein